MNATSPPTSACMVRRTMAALLIAVCALLPLLPPRPAQATTSFTVNQTGEAADLTLADNVCDASNAAGGQCTLRAAIQQANANAERDTIAFDITGAGVKTIRPTSALPSISQPVIIDGYTQPGAARNTLATGTNAVMRIVLDGSAAGDGADGLFLSASNSVVRGLVINRFRGAGIFLGPPARNVLISGCFIGTNAAGTAALGNGRDGLDVSSDGVTIGGTTPGTRNLIAGNGGRGIIALGDGTRIEGNLIGTDKTGAGALGNGFQGVLITEPATTVGGNTAAAANTIAFNGGAGVTVETDNAVGVRVLRNAIFANGGEGIDLLGVTGPDANDPGDADTGPNNLQNKPVLTAATTTGGATTMTGQLTSTANRIFVLRFFSTATGSEGKVFRGQLNVVTGPGGNAAFTFAAASAIPTGHAVTATATSETGDTSEFSIPRVVG